VEMGDEIDPNIVGGALVIRDGHNRRLESSLAQGGLDVTGLEALEIDLAHNSEGTVNAQFYVQATPDYNYVWAGSDGMLGGPDFSLGPGPHTLRFPLDVLSPAQQAYIRVVGLSIRDHMALGNLTWSISEVRTIGTPPSFRNLASHDTGTSENGLNGAFANFERGAILGNDGGQNQSGLSHNPAGSGSLRWTDLGGAGTVEDPSGAAISWGNGTILNHDCCGGANSFNERLSDFSNYDTVTFRMSATDPLGAGGMLGVQGFFQTGPSFTFQVAGGSGFSLNLPIDGQYHDLVFPLAAVSDRQNVDVFGLNLFAHTNDLVIDVDLVRFDEVAGVDGDYNADGKVDAADYVVWRKTDGGQEGYALWRENFGKTSASIAAAGQNLAVPEPSSLFILLLVLVASTGSARDFARLRARFGVFHG
jgi:hypothetical protein